MELFVTTRSTVMDEDHASFFARENAYTLRNFENRVKCHEYPTVWYQETTERGERTGISGVYAIKVRQMYMPPEETTPDEDL
jgi:hypothetical protein